jgi:hypothetical protein
MRLEEVRQKVWGEVGVRARLTRDLMNEERQNPCWPHEALFIDLRQRSNQVVTPQIQVCRDS